MAHKPTIQPGYATCFLACLLLAVSACKRQDDIQKVSTYTLKNGMDVALTVDLYPSMEDYNYSRNLESRYSLAPGESLQLQLEALKTYGLDWYSADYKYSNWVEPVIRNAGPILSTPAPLEVALGDDHRLLSIDQPDISRLILLNGNEPSSTWKAAVPAPALLTGTHIIRLGKDFSGMDSIINGGNTETRSGTFASHLGQYPAFAVDLYDANGAVFAHLLSLTWAGATNRDTIMLNFYDPGVVSFSPAVRQ